MTSRERAVEATAETVRERLLSDLEYLASYIYTSEMRYIIDLYNREITRIDKNDVSGQMGETTIPLAVKGHKYEVSK